MTLRAAIQQTPDPLTASTDGFEVRRITADGPDYDTAKAALEQQVPDGWRMLWINADR